MHGLAHPVVAAEREAEVADAARRQRARQLGLEASHSLDKTHRVIIVLGDAGGHGQDVGIEDDVVGIEAELVDQEVVGALADLELARGGVGLALLVEGCGL